MGHGFECEKEDKNFKKTDWIIQWFYGGQKLIKNHPISIQSTHDYRSKYSNSMAYFIRIY